MDWRKTKGWWITVGGELTKTLQSTYGYLTLDRMGTGKISPITIQFIIGKNHLPRSAISNIFVRIALTSLQQHTSLKTSTADNLHQISWRLRIPWLQRFGEIANKGKLTQLGDRNKNTSTRNNFNGKAIII